MMEAAMQDASCSSCSSTWASVSQGWKCSSTFLWVQLKICFYPAQSGCSQPQNFTIYLIFFVALVLFHSPFPVCSYPIIRWASVWLQKHPLLQILTSLTLITFYCGEFQTVDSTCRWQQMRSFLCLLTSDCYGANLLTSEWEAHTEVVSQTAVKSRKKY